MSKTLEVEWLGSVRYADALELQSQAVADRIAGNRGDHILLVEHPAVITLGRSSDPENLRRTPDSLRQAGIDVHEIARGGDVTYHAPGQLVGYPILDLDGLGRRDVHDHLRRIEAGLMDALEVLGVPSRRVEGRTGVFIDRARSGSADGPDRKIASIGVGIRKWVTLHGFALNVDLDLAGFDAIVPCGLHDVEMTSIARERKADRKASDVGDVWAGEPSPEEVREIVGQALVARLADGTTLEA